MTKCTICNDPQRESIDHALVTGKSLRFVAHRFGISAASVFRHKRDHIAADLARLVPDHDLARAGRLIDQVQEREAAAAAHAFDLLDELQRTFLRVHKLFDACDRWLTDPDHPEAYDLSPRAGEVLVHYTVPAPGGSRGTRLSARAPLSDLLDRAVRGLGEGAEIERIAIRHADPRDLVLKTARRLEAELQLVARLLGQLPFPPQPGFSTGGLQTAGQPQPSQVMNVNVLVASPEWVTTRAAILQALEPFPDARSAVAEAMKHASASD